MTYTVKTTYDNGFIVEELDNGTDPCESWLLLPAENLWPKGLRGFLYILAIAYLFIGIAIASDIFMSSIEMITSKKRIVVKWDPEKKTRVEREVLVWNETVANLTLMALGSSAPEILLATIETATTLGSDNVEDSLGTFTIIGSAAFNLLIITGICIVSVPKPDSKRIREFGVFIVTAVWSIWAYIWMLLVVKYISPGEITPWEAWVTLGYMPLFVLVSYCTDNGWWCKKKKVDQGEDDHVRIVPNRPRAGSFTGHILPGKELQVLEAERAQRLRENKDEHTMESGFSDDKQIVTVRRSSVEPQAFARARFRHAVVSAMSGKAAPHTKKPKMADVVKTVQRVHDAQKLGKKPEGDVLGKFTFASDRYAVLESAGVLDIDILFHRNLPSSVHMPNGDASVMFKNGSAKITPARETSSVSDGIVTGVVSVQYETREGSAKAGKDFRYQQGELTFQENEYRKTVSIPIINDNEFENDVDFYIILKSPNGGSGIGDPSIARVTILDDDEPGEFEFEQSHCVADLTTGKLEARITREHGFDGTVTLEYQTMDGTAIGGKEVGSKVDYVSQNGKVTFLHSEMCKSIIVNVNKNCKGHKNFIISLKNPSLGAKIGTKSAIVCNINKDDLGDRIADVVEDKEEEEATWSGQFVSAMTVGGSEDDDGNDIPPKWSDYLMHFLTFFWKIVGACIPPTTYGGAWPAFGLSLLYIAALTACVEQLGHLIGCVIGLKTSVTGITIIALGTSLPDTFASRTAALQDEHADAAIGNVTGSNSVNVFLGLGLPWVLSAMYHLARGTTYKVATGNLTQSVIIFSCVGTVCIIILVFRRKFVGGELGGKNQLIKWGSSLTLFFLWCIYIVLSSLKAYDILEWEV